MTTITWKEINGTKWACDENGNRCSVARFGSDEAAETALRSLENCSGCSDCFDCSDCSRCSDCFDCSDCSRCSDCSGCSGCSDCFDCSDCSRCSRCSGCFDCSDCSGCSDCSRIEGKSPLSRRPDVPVIESIHQKVFASASQPEALEMSQWHTCDTTHCRAGWVVTLAGDAGKNLERFHNTELAAMLIYKASSPLRVPPPRFFDSNEAAMADMKRLAELESANTKQAKESDNDHGHEVE